MRRVRPPLQHPQNVFRWSIRSRRGGTVTCEVCNHGQLGVVEVQMSHDGQVLFSHHYADWTPALTEAEELKADHLLDGGVLMRES